MSTTDPLTQVTGAGYVNDPGMWPTHMTAQNTSLARNNDGSLGLTKSTYNFLTLARRHIVSDK